ncbi:unnamed protein product [Rotaria sordida]|uniref:Uncharacterized protein n=1 Tax=Rotaria sordida TaxID=392033 RepID=A0A818X5T3_9BILA|nr:unnamed protein product [Rotaria sordida]CAF3732624.1 unnamed protein product [Rotaria sordida]
MTNDEQINMLVCWKEQRRQVLIKINDDISTIEKTIINVFQLQQVNNLYEYQIQYYDNDYQRFVDLYPETLHLFQQILHKLLSPNAPLRSTKQWILKIVSKAFETIRHRLGESTDDTYSYQQENDRTELMLNENTSSITDNIELSSLSGIHQSQNLPRSQTVQNNIDQQQDTSRYDDQLSQLNIANGELTITHEHPYGFGFDLNLAIHQRLQFESDMFRKSTSKTTTGGVLLRASPKLDSTTTDDILYPTVHFQIPNDQLHLAWFVYIYILTEADVNGMHYLHASKGIFDNYAKVQNKFGIIPNTDLVNPHIVQLCQNDLRDGIYELRIKVCNIRNLPSLKREYLREFSRLNNLPINNDKELLSTKTTFDLNFSSEKYHVACILFRNEEALDQCISSLTIAKSNRKRNDSDRLRQQYDEYSEISIRIIFKKSLDLYTNIDSIVYCQ